MNHSEVSSSSSLSSTTLSSGGIFRDALWSTQVGNSASLLKTRPLVITVASLVQSLHNMLTTVLVVIGLLGAYLLANAIYSVTFHPLADVPGPKLCAISRIPYWLVALSGDDVQWMKKLHDQYGPVLRFGPTDLSFATGQAWHDIHGPKVTEKAQEFSVQPVNGESVISWIFSSTSS